MCEYTEVELGVNIQKVLLTRRESIRMKHLMKNLFVYEVLQQDELLTKLTFLQFKGLFHYIAFLTNQLRGVYRITRKYNYDPMNMIVKQDAGSLIDTLKVYKAAHPVVVLDFDRTITNQKFHSLYNWLTHEGFSLAINTANPDYAVIETYLDKWNLQRPSRIYCNKGKQKKLVNLKVIAMKFTERPLFYIDDELEYLEYANLLFYQCYQYTNNGRIIHKSLNIK